MDQPRKLTLAVQLIALTFAQLFTLATIAAQPAKLTVETIASGLRDPRAVAVRPDTGSGPVEIFVAETGAGRIVKLVADKNGKPTDVVAGFSTKPTQTVGIQSLYFLDRSRLIASGGEDDGKPFVRLYELPESNTPLAADQAKSDADFAESDQARKLEASAFASIARSRRNEKVGDFLIVAALGERQPVGIAYVPIRAGTLGDLFPIRVAGSSSDLAPTAMAIGPTGYVVVASNAGEEAVRTTKLQFINPISRRIVMEVPLALTNVAALAYSPKSGNLYAAGVAKSSDEAPIGVFRIDSPSKAGAGAVPTLVESLEWPTALCFAPDGNLYVTISPKDKPPGTLVRISGEL